MDDVMFDIKLADRALHRAYTGVYNDRILENLEILRERICHSDAADTGHYGYRG